MHKRRGWGGVSRLSVEKFSSRSAEKFRRGTLQRFKKFRVSKKFMHKKGRGCYDSPSKKNCVTVPKHFVEDPFCASANFWHRKTLWIIGVRGGGGGASITNFRQNFLSHCAEKLHREPFLLSEKFCYRNFSCIRGGDSGITIFRRIDQIKKVGKGWDSLQNPVILPTVPREPLEWNFWQMSVKS